MSSRVAGPGAQGTYYIGGGEKARGGVVEGRPSQDMRRSQHPGAVVVRAPSSDWIAILQQSNWYVNQADFNSCRRIGAVIRYYSDTVMSPKP